MISRVLHNSNKKMFIVGEIKKIFLSAVLLLTCDSAC